MWLLLLLAMAGGAIGSGARYVVNVACTACIGPGFPWATLTVNVIGSFLMGVVVAASIPILGGSPQWRTFLATGVLGGFTTFSAFSLDIWELVDRNRAMLAAIYVVGSVCVSFAALVAGLLLTKAILR